MANELIEPSFLSPTRSVSLAEYMIVPLLFTARHPGLVPMSTVPASVSFPVVRSTLKIWMPRPLPGGKSTWVGSVSFSGELKVPM